MSTIKVVTFNLRYDCADDKEQGFPYRKPIILKKIKEESPDIIGFQEVLPHMLIWLRENLNEYTIVGIGREQDYTGEHNPVAFKKDKFELFGLDTFWLSPTPHIPGSRFKEQSICPRICTVVTLKHREMDKPIRCYNTHIDHESSLARQIGMGAVLERIKKDQAYYPLSYMLMGDFNAEPQDQEIQQIEAAGLRDCTKSIEYTFHAYGDESTYCKIDYIFVSQDIQAQEVVAWNEKINNLYISDHYPVAVEIVVP